MADEPHGFTQARARLEDIVSQVRKKDTSLEKSLDLLEEGVRLANQCTELIDHADWEAAAAPATGADESTDDTVPESTDVAGGQTEAADDAGEAAVDGTPGVSEDDAESGVE